MTRTDGLGTLLNMDGLVSVKELAARWGVTRDTARQRTLDAGFPQVIRGGAPGRLCRWDLDSFCQARVGGSQGAGRGARTREDH